MDEATTLKQKVKVLDDDLRVERQLTQEKDEQFLSAKEKLATVAARSVEAFQTTDEYNTVLFSWYFKGFELLRRYLVKHPSGVNMESLDLEEVDKEMALDEAAQSSAPDGDVPDPATDAPAAVDASVDTWPYYLKKKFLLYLVDALLVLGPFLFFFFFEQSFILRTMLITQWLWVKMKHAYPFWLICTCSYLSILRYVYSSTIC